MTRRFWLIVTCLVSVWLLSACKAQVITEIESDGSGEMRTEIGFTPEEAQSMQAMAEDDQKDICQIMSENQEDKSLTYSLEKRGDETWCVAITKFADLEELRLLYDEMEGVKINTLEITSGNLVYDLEVDASSSEIASQVIDTSWRLIVPGKVGKHNAEEVDGQTLIWDMSSGGESKRVYVESTASRSLVPSDASIWIYIGVAAAACLCLVIVVTAVVLAIVLWRRKTSVPPAA